MKRRQYSQETAVTFEIKMFYIFRLSSSLSSKMSGGVMNVDLPIYQERVRYPLSHATPYLATLQPLSYATPFFTKHTPSKLSNTVLSFTHPSKLRHTQLSYAVPHTSYGGAHCFPSWCCSVGMRAEIRTRGTYLAAGRRMNAASQLATLQPYWLQPTTHLDMPWPLSYATRHLVSPHPN
jgi:hypothetical protein